MDFNTDLRYIKGIGERRCELFKKLGIDSIDALLSFYPRLYEDWSKIRKIKDANFGETVCVKAIVDTNFRENKIRKGLTIYKGEVTDGQSLMKLTIFNNQYAANSLKDGEEYLFYGKITGNLYEKEMMNPEFAKAETGEIIRPIYRQTQNLSTKVIQNVIRNLLDNIGDKIEETIPDEIRKKYNLCTRFYALENIHFPSSDHALEISKKRLVFEELLVLQLGLVALKGRNRKFSAYTIKKDFTKDFFDLLPFKMTNAQQRAVSEALNDMKTNVPMNRLLQGDVGSGKTAVAAALVYNAAKNNIQSALMAPTEILAIQHYNTFEKLFENADIKIALLTGSTSAKEKRIIKEKLASGEIDFVTGTHALIQKDVFFSNLGLVITDEQHRFGVEQRGNFSAKGKNPHTFVMSATPIPRTLALIIYGDLDVSILDELPPLRQKIETYKITSALHIRAMNYVKKHLNEGRQGYVICPLVEESEMPLISAEEYYDKMSKGIFKDYKLGILHGKMKSGDKEKVMADFVEGKIQLLISTTVVEVGVDVPNAVIMVIENAERFGLSQLHQLRGRIGRGKHLSTCILVSDAENEEAVKRLDILCKTTDGFKIADEDLKLRGPGDFFGARQHGLPELKIANMIENIDVLKETQKCARMILEDDPKLQKPSHKNLKNEVKKLFESAYTNSLN